MIEALPLSGRLVMAGGLVLMALGVLLPVLLMKAWTLLSFLIHGGVLLPAGVSTLALGAVKGHLEGRAAATRRAESDALVARNAEMVRRVLGPSAASGGPIVVVQRRPFSHGIHILLSVLTLGLWIPIWIIAALLHRD